jgi:hypothetical protein
MKTMQAHRFTKAATAAVLWALAGFAAADTPAAGNPRSGMTANGGMAPLDEYLMTPVAEIALARSAAPAAISGKATILALKPQGYETAVNGSNGFTCLVERSWMVPFDRPDFWNPKLRAPTCYNQAASKSVLVYTLRRTKLALAGHSREQMLEEVSAAVARKELPTPQPGAMSYMMSKDQLLGDGAGVTHWHSHLMFHVPKTDGASWGANLPGSPVVFDAALAEAHPEYPEPQSIFFVPVGHWSDGTAAPPL